MKKPVMAIDMRRTATVLDFAIPMVSIALWHARMYASYLSWPLCDVLWTMRQRTCGLGGSRVNVKPARESCGELPLFPIGKQH